MNKLVFGVILLAVGIFMAATTFKTAVPILTGKAADLQDKTLKNYEVGEVVDGTVDNVPEIIGILLVPDSAVYDKKLFGIKIGEDHTPFYIAKLDKQLVVIHAAPGEDEDFNAMYSQGKSSKDIVARTDEMPKEVKDYILDNFAKSFSDEKSAQVLFDASVAPVVLTQIDAGSVKVQFFAGAGVTILGVILIIAGIVTKRGR